MHHIPRHDIKPGQKDSRNTEKCLMEREGGGERERGTEGQRERGRQGDRETGREGERGNNNNIYFE